VVIQVAPTLRVEILRILDPALADVSAEYKAIGLSAAGSVKTT
jgi:hypothetical protein